MAREAIETLGFGFPTFKSQSLGTQPNRGPWVALTPRIRALQTLPPKAKKQLQGLARLRGKIRGLGQEEYEILAGNYDVYDYGGDYSATGIPSASDYPTGLQSPGVSSWGTDETSGAAAGGGSSWSWEGLIKGATAVSQAVAQQRIIDLNIQRARAGLPLLDPTKFSPSAAVNFGLTPQASQMLLIGGIALGAVLLLRSKRK